ncbi:MAG: DMT family transporter, partial [Cyclobacteriaceae bacterium]|nr:DMT family transporter [Cyclobacteriaceae bacterium]
MSNQPSESSVRNWIYLIILALVWGSSFILIKRGLEIFSPGELGAFRIVAAATFLLPLSLPRVRFLNSVQVQNLIIVGLVGSFIPAFLFAKAQTQLSSSLTGVL